MGVLRLWGRKTCWSPDSYPQGPVALCWNPEAQGEPKFDIPQPVDTQVALRSRSLSYSTPPAPATPHKHGAKSQGICVYTFFLISFTSKAAKQSISKYCLSFLCPQVLLARLLRGHVVHPSVAQKGGWEPSANSKSVLHTSLHLPRPLFLGLLHRISVSSSSFIHLSVEVTFLTSRHTDSPICILWILLW